MFYEDPHFKILPHDSGSRFIKCQNEVLVVAITENQEVIFIIEPSVAFNEHVILLPGGTIEENETLFEAANRELQEEAGYHAGQLFLLGEIRPWSKYLQVRSYILLGLNLTERHLDGDEDHEIDQIKVPLAEFENFIGHIELFDARVISAVVLAKAYLQNQWK